VNSNHPQSVTPFSPDLSSVRIVCNAKQILLGCMWLTVNSVVVWSRRYRLDVDNVTLRGDDDHDWDSKELRIGSRSLFESKHQMTGSLPRSERAIPHLYRALHACSFVVEDFHHGKYDCRLESRVNFDSGNIEEEMRPTISKTRTFADTQVLD
jgi:hypothetical protein